MKKKFLSLMMAAAVVATTSVSAFAEDTTNVTAYGDTANVTINGSVDADNGDSAPGTISVSVPTAMNFRVNSQGNLEGSKITITNRGVDKVEVLAYEFINNRPNSGIKVKAPGEVGTSETRANIALWLQGKSGRAYFKSEAAGSNKKGICDENGTEPSSDDGIVVSKIDASNGTDELTLGGHAGTERLDNNNKPLSGEFTLKLKIRKSNS